MENTEQFQSVRSFPPRAADVVKAVALFFVAVVFVGCSATRFPASTQGCRLRTYINLHLQDYLNSRYHSEQPIRALVVPYDVPESFARSGYESEHFGREIARKFQAEIYPRGVLPIVELYAQDSWPGKREEFFSGNYRALELARNAGYDLLVVGYMEDLKGDEGMTIHTKIIDASNNVTIWFAKTYVFSKDRSLRRWLSSTRMYRDRPELFPFYDLAERYAYCTVDRILNTDPVPE